MNGIATVQFQIDFRTGRETALTGAPSTTENAQLALPLTASEQKESKRQLDQLHPGNRFRLMFGQLLLPQGLVTGSSRSST
ncbi:MAG: hypothetical protein B7Z37_08505 [Verrucomicrobia bacterium 12-59-8]|nr:MAG: hypothetical protein B7Z37_08505 [Verrucomicrobia bacterium 12-59-8]